ncbi:MAG TPA: hypothetical protein VEW69_04775 [Alphaproteobacteria bacterium]|nr:hypothetical protein [Alphaproteobacteria bacterium]
MGSKLTAEQVKTEVRRAWQAISEHDLKTLRCLYGPDAVVFHPSSHRFELGALTVVRFEREYSHPECKVSFQLGEIHVLFLGENAEAAVANYTFELHIKNVVTPAGLIDRHVVQGRATQVFAYASDGKLKIMSEHRSSAAKRGAPATPPASECIPTSAVPI